MYVMSSPEITYRMVYGPLNDFYRLYTCASECYCLYKFIQINSFIITASHPLYIEETIEMQ